MCRESAEKSSDTLDGRQVPFLGGGGGGQRPGRAGSLADRLLRSQRLHLAAASEETAFPLAPRQEVWEFPAEFSK